MIEFNNIIYLESAKGPVTRTWYTYNSATGQKNEANAAITEKIGTVAWADGSTTKPKPNFPPQSE